MEGTYGVWYWLVLCVFGYWVGVLSHFSRYIIHRNMFLVCKDSLTLQSPAGTFLLTEYSIVLRSFLRRSPILLMQCSQKEEIPIIGCMQRLGLVPEKNGQFNYNYVIEMRLPNLRMNVVSSWHDGKTHTMLLVSTTDSNTGSARH